MKNEIKLSFISKLRHSLSSHPDLIQFVIGPRQIGKTTGVLQLLSELSATDFHFVSADGPISKAGSWLESQWLLLTSKNPNGVLIIDEIQKVEDWSETIKKLWDRQKLDSHRARLILLGSSSLGIQKGLSESLTGRFLVHRVFQWNLEETQTAFGLSLDDYLHFGGYPGSYVFAHDRVQWLNYVRESIVETVVGRDILQLSGVKSPALFRQCFDLACSYGGQEISYTKLLGQLQNRGNVELITHYLELFEGAYLLKQLFKFSNKPVLRKPSSPKILPLCTALFSLTRDADLDSKDRGRAFEIAVGCELARLPGQLFYWREGNAEVDFVHQFGRKITAVEVKSGRKKSPKGLSVLSEKFPSAQRLLVTPENMPGVLERLRAPLL